MYDKTTKQRDLNTPTVKVPHPSRMDSENYAGVTVLNALAQGTKELDHLRRHKVEPFA